MITKLKSCSKATSNLQTSSMFESYQNHSVTTPSTGIIYKKTDE